MSDAAIAASLFLGLCLLFWSGRSHTYGPGDSPQHVVAALTWGVPHPPGYPLYTAIAHLWSRLPWSEPAAAVNGLSGVCSAGAAAVLFLLLRLQGCGVFPALTAAGLMALAPLFWFYALVAEVRGANDLLALAAAYAACRWAAAGDRRWLLGLGVLTGLGLAHHPTFLFITPALAWWAFSRRPRNAELLQAAALAAVSLCASYAVLGLRLAHSRPLYDLYGTDGWRGLPALFLRKHYGGAFRMTAGTGFGGYGALDPGKLLQHMGWMLRAALRHAGPALALSAAVLALPVPASKRALSGWALWFGAAGALFLGISSQQMAECAPEYARALLGRHYLLPFIALFALAGHGAQALSGKVRPGLVKGLAAAAFLGPLLLAPLCLRHSDPLRDYMRGVLRDSGPRDIVILAADDSIFASIHADLIAHEAGDRVFLTPGLFAFPRYVRELRSRHPDLVLPPREPGKGLSVDWSQWKRLNPGRVVLAEPVLRDVVLQGWPQSRPQGGLLRLEEKKTPADPAADALRFLAQPENAYTRAELRDYTQEVYVLHGRQAMAEWVGSRLDTVKDQPLIRRLKALLDALGDGFLTSTGQNG